MPYMRLAYGVGIGGRLFFYGLLRLLKSLYCYLRVLSVMRAERSLGKAGWFGLVVFRHQYIPTLLRRSEQQFLIGFFGNDWKCEAESRPMV